MPAVQYAALIADLMAKTKYTLAKTATPATDFYTGPVTLRMRTKEDTELIVTDFQTNAPVHEYILVTIQNCKWMLEKEGEGEEGKE
jgi:hypothetical protein